MNHPIDEFDGVTYILETARELLKQGWVQRYPAVDINGRRTGVFTERAVAYCLVGALRHVTGKHASAFRLDMCIRAHAIIRSVLPRKYTNLSTYNDAPGRTQEQVVNLLTEALASRRGVLLQRRQGYDYVIARPSASQWVYM